MRLDADTIIGASHGGQLAVSHDPRSAGSSNASQGWLEVIVDGMTFDFCGLRPGPCIDAVAADYHYDIDQDVPGRMAALPILPGPHLTGAERSLPVIRGMVQVARTLCDAPGLLGVAWSPSSSLMSISYFRTVVDAWLVGGPFPALGLTSLKPAFDGGLQSEGLAYFIGRELRIEPDVTTDRVAATRIATRLINTLVESGSIESTMSVTGPDGERLSLAPSANGKFLRLRAG